MTLPSESTIDSSCSHKNSEVLFSEEGMLASRRLDINASYGCSLICRYCFHLGIAGDMRYEKNQDGSESAVFDNPGKYFCFCSSVP